jgi:DNA polymerase-3 subunit delta
VPIRLAQLDRQLAQSIAPVYLIAGSEPLLVQEGREQVIRRARENGFEERQILVVDRAFDWAEDLAAAAAPSLFNPRKVLDVRVASGKPGQIGARVLAEWGENPDTDVVLVLSFGNWDAASRKTKWAQVIDRAGVLVEVWPLKPSELPPWVSQRMSAAGLQADREAIAMLAELVEGNLLAAQQEIDKLAMVGTGKRISAEDVEKSVANSARFDAFRLADCALRGEASECLRVAAGLLRNHVAIQPVTAALYNELSLAEGLCEVQNNGGDERAFFSRARVWPMRQGPMKQAAGRLRRDDFGKAFRCLSRIDLQGKGRAAGDPWRTLDDLLLFLCAPRKQGLGLPG